VGEVARVALDEPDKPMQATYDQEETIKITSFREHSLFQVLNILRHLDQPSLELQLSSHPQFATAIFPYGVESIMQEAEERKKANP
jgi:hypothetical protein